MDVQTGRRSLESVLPQDGATWSGGRHEANVPWLRTWIGQRVPTSFAMAFQRRLPRQDTRPSMKALCSASLHRPTLVGFRGRFGTFTVLEVEELASATAGEDGGGADLGLSMGDACADVPSTPGRRGTDKGPALDANGTALGNVLPGGTAAYAMNASSSGLANGGDTRRCSRSK